MDSQGTPAHVILPRTILDWSSTSDPRKNSPHNEDCLTARLSGNQTLLVVADGLGGHKAGEVASRMVARNLPKEYFAKPGVHLVDEMTEAIRETNRAIHEAGKDEETHGMCSTVVASLVLNHFALFLHVGDSRGYLFRQGSCVHRTTDHAMKKITRNLNPSLARTNSKSVLTQSMGARASVVPELSIHRIEEGDIIVLCSDGLTDVVTDTEIADMVTSRMPEEACEALVETARRNGSDDDLSVIVAAVVQVVDGPSLDVHLSNLDKYVVAAS